MAGTGPVMSRGAKEEEIMGMLFGEQIRGLAGDGFGGSKDEREIYMHVLYGRRIGNLSNNFASSKMMLFQTEEGRSKKQSGYVNYENLAHSNPSSVEVSKGNSSENVKLNKENVNSVQRLERCPFQSMSTANITDAKSLKLSSSDPLHMKEPVTTLLETDNHLVNCCPANSATRSMALDSATAHSKLQSGVVESFGHGVLSSCYFDSSQILTGSSVEFVAMLSKNERRNRKGSNNKVLLKATSSTCPNSKESHDSILSTPYILIDFQEAYKASKCVDQRTNGNFDSGIVDASVGMSSGVDFSAKTPSLAIKSQRAKEVNIPDSSIVNDSGETSSIEGLQANCGSHLVYQKYNESNIPDSGIVSEMVQASSMKCVSPTSNSLALQNKQSTEELVPGSDIVGVSVEMSSVQDIPVCLSSQELKSRSATETNPPVLSIRSLEPSSTRDLTFCLRSHAAHLLKDAGWTIQTRKRKEAIRRPKYDYYYRSPEGPILPSLPKAWVACGSRLLASTLHAGAGNELVRVWVDIDEFWCDLANILACIQKEIKFSGKTISLLHRWQLLDPFMAVVCIDMKVGALKYGMVVKAGGSEAVILSNNKSLFLASKGVDKVQGHSSLGNSSHAVQSDVHVSTSEVSGCSSRKQVSALQSSDNLKRKRRHENLINRKTYDAHTRSRNLEILPRCTRKELCDAENLHEMNYFSLGSPASDMPFQGTVAGGGLSRFDCSNPLENSMLQIDGLYSSPIGKSNLENDSSIESRIEHPVHFKGTPSNSVEAANQDKVGFCNVPRDSIKRALSFQESHENGVGFAFKPKDAAKNTHGRSEEPNEVRQQSWTGSSNTGDFFILNPSHEHPSAGQEFLLFYPQQKIISFSQDGYCRQELVGHFISPCDLGINMLQEIQSYFCQSASTKDIIQLFGISNDSAHNTVFPFPAGVINFGSQDACHLVEKLAIQGILEKPDYQKDVVDRSSRSEYEKVNAENQPIHSMKQTRKRSKKTSEVQLRSVKNSKHNVENEDRRKARRKSKKISELGATKLNENCTYSISFSLDHLTNDCSSQAHQEEVINLREELVSELTKNSLSHKEIERSPRMETKHTEFRKAPNQCCGFSASVGASEVVGNSLSTHHDKRSDEALFLDSLNNKGVDGVEKAKVRKKRGRRKIESNVVMNNNLLLAVDGEVSLKLQHDKGDSEALMSDPRNSKEESEVNKTVECKKRVRKKQHNQQAKDDNLLSSIMIKNKDSGYYNKNLATIARTSESKASRKSKRGSRLSVRPAGRDGKTSTNGKRALKGARTVLCWLIDVGVLSLGDIIQYHSPRSKIVVKEGRITRAGILCKCCKKTLSVSDFKQHAGFKVKAHSLNLFLKSGKPLISCQLQAWAVEYKLRKNDVQIKEIKEGDKNDDTCRLCGDGGELICCDSCPYTYHQACLYLQDLPEGSWYCPNCACKICGYVLNVLEDSDSIAMIECSQCECRYHETCIKERIRCDAIGSNMWFCGQKCLEVYTGLHSIVGVTNCMNDGFSWTFLRCNNYDKKFHSAQKTALVAECSTKLAIALSIMEESFLPMFDPRTGNNMIPQILYNLGSNITQVNYQGFYTVALEKDDELISIASIRMHGVTLAEMPLIATCCEHRRKGMCRRLVHVIEKMLKLLKIEMLVLSAIPESVDTWISAFGFKHINDDDKKKLSNINLIMFPGTTMLKKHLYECESSKLDMESNNEGTTYVFSEETNSNIHAFKENDPYSEALNFYKLSLGEIKNINTPTHS